VIRLLFKAEQRLKHDVRVNLSLTVGIKWLRFIVFKVMYDSGFNTKGAFNLAFKKIMGKTPTQFREV
jgi:AraC-like DNA-binding protein